MFIYGLPFFVPISTDPTRLRAILETDRAWGLYLLGDLEPHLWPHCQWWCDHDAVVLLYRRFETPVLATFGPLESLRPLLAELPPEPRLVLHVRRDVLPLLAPYRVATLTPMVRMSLDPDAYRPAASDGLTRLSPADRAAIEALYRDGDSIGEMPDFFVPEMLDDGYFHGQRDGGALVAVAGTHLVAPNIGVAAVGNVYTRRDRRGHGLASMTTSAVVSALLAAGLDTVALSVNEKNAAAIRVYQRLGFHEHCGFYEGLLQMS